MTLRSTFTAVVAAAALALSVPAPAVAGPDGEDLLKLLAGAAAVGLIAREVQRNNYRNEQGRGQVYAPPVQRGSVYQAPRFDQTYDRDYRTPSERHYPREERVTRRAALPYECAIDYQGRKGWQRVYGANCLRDTGFRARLPDYCALDIRTSRGVRTVYEENCLREAGFRAGTRYE